MDWVASAIRYGPELFAAGEAAGRAINSWVNGEENGEATADMIKPIVMLGATMLAENKCQTAVGAGATTAASSAAYDLAVSSMTGKDYGIIKDINSGDYTRAAAKSGQEFGAGAVAHVLRSRPSENLEYKGKKARAICTNQDDDDDEAMSPLDGVEDILRGIAQAFPQEQHVAKSDQWRFT